MALQETGGRKQGKDGGMVAIPVAARRTATAVTRPSQWPGALLRRSRAYTVPLGGGRIGVFQRRGRGGSRLMYVLSPFVQIEARFGMHETVAAVVTDRFAAHFLAAFQEAASRHPG